MERLEKVLDLFDEYNKHDPNKVSWDGVLYPAEYFFAVQLFNWVKKLSASAGEHLLIASRAQHIGRWEIPRETYAGNKAGYLTWRSDLSKFHASVAARLMKTAGYESDSIASVERIILKQNIKGNEEVQTMENALCLVFLEFQYEAFLLKQDEDKVVRILQKSWKKMSKPGRDAALELSYSEKGKQLLQQALDTLAT